MTRSQITSSQLRHNPLGQRRGMTIVWMVIFITVMFAFAVMAIDIGWLRLMEGRALTGAEAGALGAANSLATDRYAAADAAIEFAGRNKGHGGAMITLVAGVDNAGGDLVFGRWDHQLRQFEPETLAPDAVRVSVNFRENHPNGEVELLLAEFLGIASSGLSSSVIAQARPREPVPGAVWVLEKNAADALNLRRDVTMNVNGMLAVASSSPSAVSIRSNSTAQATVTNLLGDVVVDSDDALTGMLRFGDEFPSVPSFPPLNLQLLPIHLDVVLSPGINALPAGRYPNGIAANQGVITLQGGIYLFEGQGIVLTGTATLQSRESIIVLSDNGAFSVDAGATVQLSGPRPNGKLNDWQGLTLTSAPNEGGIAPYLYLGVGSTFIANGAIHLPDSPIEVNDASLSATSLSCRTLRAYSDAVLTAGGSTPHPVDILLVD